MTDRDYDCLYPKKFRDKLRRRLRWFRFLSWCRHTFIAPFGWLRKPVPVLWDDYGAWTCPHCGEIPYSEKRCYFCGQRFITEDEP